MASCYDKPFWAKNFYDHKARWLHYNNQVRYVRKEIRKRGGSIENFKVLEVGPSHGFVTDYLKKFGVDITTIDNKLDYKPDVLGDVRDMPFEDNSFDMILVCEVLEHMEYENFPISLREMRRVSRGKVLLSLPDVRRILFHINFKLPFMKHFDYMVKIPTFKKHVLKAPGAHYFEIGARGYPPSFIKEEILNSGFNIISSKVFSDTPKNHYFLMEK